MDPRIADYIRANRRRYTRDAITQQLVEAGHDRDEVERTWAALEAPDPDAEAGEGFWKRFALILIGVNLAVFLAVGLLTGMLTNLPAGSFVLVVVFGVALVIGALIAWGLVAATGPAKMSPTTALVVGSVIPIVFALLVGGTCYALVGAVGLPPPPPTEGVMQVRLDAPLNIQQEVRATCQSSGGGGDESFNVYAEFAGGDGEQFFVSVGAFQPAPGAPPEPSVFVSLGSGPGWGSEMATGAAEMDAALGGLSGSMSFEGLPAMPMEGREPGGPDTPAGEPLSGEITWTCE